MDDFAQLAERVGRLERKPINLNTDIIGLFETVSVAPTAVPANAYQQVKIYSNAGTFRIYFYVMGSGWHYAALT